MNILSSRSRLETLKKLAADEFDLLIIGGGITGAGIALDAASRGMRVALVEMRDFASGTSSKSTKLIHGGLRYLKQFEIALVREVGRERAIVHRLAPHLVASEKMLLPLMEGGTYGELATSMGLWVYDVLAGVEGTDKRVMLSREETKAKEPLLRDDLLKGGGYYAEYRTDDARLTIENIKTAARFGALSLNYAKVEDFTYDAQGVISGVQCRDQLSGQSFEVKAHYVVSAAGPWVDRLRRKDGVVKGKHLFLSKGVHIVVPHERLPINQAVYFDVPDGRMIFAIPRQRVTYIGTTDTPYDGDLNRVPIDLKDVQYLLDATNNMFPTVHLQRSDVESSWAGLRPLIHEEGKSPSEMSRKDEIFESETGLLSIAGGKLTGYRKMAERIVDLVVQKMQQRDQRNFKKNDTDEIQLSGGPFAGTGAVRAYVQELSKSVASKGLPSTYAEYLVANYGRQSDQILEQMDVFDDLEKETALIRAEAWFAVHHELACTLNDFYIRRSGRMYFYLPSIRASLDVIVSDMTAYLGWDDKQIQIEKNNLHQAIREVTEFH